MTVKHSHPGMESLPIANTFTALNCTVGGRATQSDKSSYRINKPANMASSGKEQLNRFRHRQQHLLKPNRRVQRQTCAKRSPPAHRYILSSTSTLPLGRRGLRDEDNKKYSSKVLKSLFLSSIDISCSQHSLVLICCSGQQRRAMHSYGWEGCN